MAVKLTRSKTMLSLNLRRDNQRIRENIPISEIIDFILDKRGSSRIGPKGATKLSVYSDEFTNLYTFKKQTGTQKRHRVSIKNLNERLGDLYLHEIDEYVLEQYRNARLNDKNPVSGKELRPATVNRETTQLKLMVKMAKRWGYLTVNTLSDFEKLPERNERDRWLTEEELNKILSFLDKDWSKDIVELLAWTGLRVGELRALKWRDVDFDNGSIKVESEKKQQRIIRYVYLRSRPTQILLRRKETEINKDEYVFHTYSGNAKREAAVHLAFQKALKKSGLEHCTLHDLRRTFAVHHSIAYKDIFMLRDELGHSDFRTLHRYVRISRVYNATDTIFKNDLNIKFGSQIVREISSKIETGQIL